MRDKKKRRKQSRPSFPPRTNAELLGFICDEHKRHAVAIIEMIAERFQINVRIEP